MKLVKIEISLDDDNETLVVGVTDAISGKLDVQGHFRVLTEAEHKKAILAITAVQKVIEQF